MTPPLGQALRSKMVLGRLLAGSGVVLAAYGVVTLAVIGRADHLLEGAAMFAIFTVGFGGLAWLAISRRPDNRAVWVPGWASLFAGLSTAGWATHILISNAAGLDVSTAAFASLSPSQVPVAAAVSYMLIALGPMAGFFLMLTIWLLIFPDGKLPSSRWRWAAGATVVSMVAGVAAIAWPLEPGSTVPYGTPPEQIPGIGAFVDPLYLILLLLSGLSAVSLVPRYRRSAGDVRQQYRWVGLGTGALFFSVFVVDPVDWALLVATLGVAISVLSYGIAVTKYRLYDIDVVINKTVMVAALGVIIAALYVAVVVGVGSLLGGSTQVGVQVAATVVVALAFGPVRRRAQQWANRAVYGERATPYEVLARFSHRAAEASDDELLARIPRLIVDGTGAVEATLWVKSNEGFRPAATWPESIERTEIPPADSFEDPNADYSLPVFHDGELLGGLSLVKARGEQLPPVTEQLVANLASGMGLALRNSRLTTQLRGQVAELEASRERILAAADEARRALERDLDSGPQQQLVALKVMLGPTRKQAAQAGATKTADVLAQLETDAGEAIRAVREFSGGVYPPLLEAEGLAAAITQQTQKSALPISVAADGLGRYPREVEAAVYFTILEALQNIAKYADASTVSVVLQQADGRLSFEVTDDGTGFDPSTIAAGSGLANMADRLDTAGGTWNLESAPGFGTTVRGTVPIGDRISV
jgi:signal transduction histidine kinase